MDFMDLGYYVLVAPLVGAWIEIDNEWFDIRNDKVAPLVGAWIEMCMVYKLPFDSFVAPLVGAWIEIKI